MTKKSKREIERAVDEMDGGDPDDERDPVAEARERWDADDYEHPGAIARVMDAYTLAYEDLVEGFQAFSEYIPDPDLGMKALFHEESGREIPPLPPTPTEDVAEAVIDYGEARGIDARALRDRHGDDWMRHLVENLYYEGKRHRAEESRIVWKPDEVEDDMRRWRVALEAQQRDEESKP